MKVDGPSFCQIVASPDSNPLLQILQISITNLITYLQKQIGHIIYTHTCTHSMRRSLGGSNGGMLRTVQRAAGGTSVATDSFSHTPTTPSSKPTKTSSSSCKSTVPNSLLITTNAPSSPFSRNQSTVPVSWTFSSSSSSVSDEFDDQWECIDHGVFQESVDFGEDHFVFGSVPSVDEVQHAVSSLQQ